MRRAATAIQKMPSRRVVEETEMLELFDALSVRARHDVLAIHPRVSRPEEFFSASVELDRRSLSRRVGMRMIIPPPAERFRREVQVAQHGVVIPARVRTVMPLQMIVVDDDLCLVEGEPGPDGWAIEVVQESAAVRALRSLAEHLWATSAVPPRDLEWSPSPRHLSVLRLLVRGLKDDAVARQLGVCTRTVRRTIDEMEARTGAAGRMELALMAQRLGWLPASPQG